MQKRNVVETDQQEESCVANAWSVVQLHPVRRLDEHMASAVEFNMDVVGLEDRDHAPMQNMDNAWQKACDHLLATCKQPELHESPHPLVGRSFVETT